MAFIWAADSNDIRSEGMSYGMMLAVQMGMQAEFDKLWKFAKQYMQYPANTGHDPRGSTTFVGKARSAAARSRSGPHDGACAGRATSTSRPRLYLADQRWKSAGAVNYKQEADKRVGGDAAQRGHGRQPLPDSSTHHRAHGRVRAVRGARTASPTRATTCLLSTSCSRCTDPLPTPRPGRPSPPRAGATWSSQPTPPPGCTPTTPRSLAHPHHGLRRRWSRPVQIRRLARRDEHGPWTTPWFSQDPTLKAQVEKYHAFFANKLGTDNVTNALFNVDGSNPLRRRLHRAHGHARGGRARFERREPQDLRRQPVERRAAERAVSVLSRKRVPAGPCSPSRVSTTTPSEAAQPSYGPL